MRIAGAILMAIGLVVAFVAFMLDTTVASPGTYIGGEYVGGGLTHNLGLLQRQMMVLHSGLATFVVGGFLLGSGSILGRLTTPGTGERPNSNSTDETDRAVSSRVDEDRALNYLGLGIIVFFIVLIGLFALVF